MPERFCGPRGDIFLLGTIQGLLSEADRVRDVIARTAPATVALGLSPEGVAMLSAFEGEPTEEAVDEMPDHDIIYSVVLGRYGPVGLPPPDMLAAVRDAATRELAVLGVDLAEDAYEDAFTKQVSTWGFLKYGRIQKRLAKRPPKADNAGEFVLAWDAKVRRVSGLARVEALRETTIAENTIALMEENKAPILLVVDYAREAGVRDALLARGFTRDGRE